MDRSAPNFPSSRVFDVESARAFVEAVRDLASSSAETTLLAFRLRGGCVDLPRAQPFAEALHLLANLAAETRMISLCHVEGPCTGAALGLALRCDVVTVAPSASMSIAWDDPAAAAVHAGAAERIGTVACERLLFDRTCAAAEAAERGLASYLCEDFDAALMRCTARIRTAHATARAYRLANPYPLAIATALTEPFGEAG